MQLVISSKINRNQCFPIIVNVRYFTVSKLLISTPAFYLILSFSFPFKKDNLLSFPFFFTSFFLPFPTTYNLAEKGFQLNQKRVNLTIVSVSTWKLSFKGRQITIISHHSLSSFHTVASFLWAFGISHYSKIFPHPAFVFRSFWRYFRNMGLGMSV